MQDNYNNACILCNLMGSLIHNPFMMIIIDRQYPVVFSMFLVSVLFLAVSFCQFVLHPSQAKSILGLRTYGAEDNFGISPPGLSLGHFFFKCLFHIDMILLCNTIQCKNDIRYFEPKSFNTAFRVAYPQANPSRIF